MQQFDALLYLVMLVGIGYIGVKVKLIPASVTDLLPQLLINLCYPAMILSSLISINAAELVQTGLTAALITLVITVLLYLLGKVALARIERPKRILFQFMLGIGNVTYVGIPLISIFLGEKGVYYAVIHGVVQDILIWLLFYPSYLDNKKKDKLRLLKNPCMVALILGIFFSIFRIRLPDFLTLTLDRLSFVTSPLALLFLGAIIAEHGALGWIKNIPAIVAGMIKVILLPLLIFFSLILITDSYTSLLMALLFSCPTPIMSIVWARQYDGDTKLSIHSCIFSTLLYLVVMSILLSILTANGWISAA
jgi:malate permease and related proteins